MEPSFLNERFCSDIIFYCGAYDAVLSASEKSAEAVYRKVKNNIHTLGKGGGYIFAGFHNLPEDHPESHIRAILQAFEECKYEPELLGAHIPYPT